MVSKRGEPKGRPFGQKRKVQATVTKMRRTKAEAMGMQEKRSGNGDQKRGEPKEEAIRTQEKGTGTSTKRGDSKGRPQVPERRDLAAVTKTT